MARLNSDIRWLQAPPPPPPPTMQVVCETSGTYREKKNWMPSTNLSLAWHSLHTLYTHTFTFSWCNMLLLLLLSYHLPPPSYLPLCLTPIPTTQFAISQTMSRLSLPHFSSLNILPIIISWPHLSHQIVSFLASEASIVCHQLSSGWVRSPLMKLSRRKVRHLRVWHPQLEYNITSWNRGRLRAVWPAIRDLQEVLTEKRLVNSVAKHEAGASTRRWVCRLHNDACHWLQCNPPQPSPRTCRQEENQLRQIKYKAGDSPTVKTSANMSKVDRFLSPVVYWSVLVKMSHQSAGGQGCSQSARRRDGRKFYKWWQLSASTTSS